MWTTGLTKFWRDDRGATLVVASVSMPVLFLAVSFAIEIAGAAEYRQRLLTTAELTCRHVTLYLNKQAGKPSRDADAEFKVFASIIEAHARTQGVAAEPMPFTIAIRDGRPEIELWGRYRFLMFDLSTLGMITPRGLFPCQPIADASAVSRGRRAHA